MLVFAIVAISHEKSLWAVVGIGLLERLITLGRRIRTLLDGADWHLFYGNTTVERILNVLQGVGLLLVLVLLAVYLLTLRTQPKKTAPQTQTQTQVLRGRLQGQSCFDGTVGGYLGHGIVAWLWIVFTLGIGTAWAYCYLQRWITSHTVINGARLVFVGKGSALFGKLLLWTLLCILTLGIFSLWIPVKLQKWITENTHLA